MSVNDGAAILALLAVALTASHNGAILPLGAEGRTGTQAAKYLVSPEGDVQVVTGDRLGQAVVGASVSVAGSNQNGQGVSEGGIANELDSAEGGAGEPIDGAQVIVMGPGECQWHVINPPAGDPRWQGNDPGTGSVIERNCNGPVETLFMAGPAPSGPEVATPPPPSPEELAARAYRELPIPDPTISVGPDRAKLAVSLWTWFWINNPGPLTSTAAAGGVSVTVTATLASVTWSLGEPAATGGAYAPGPPVTITCQGTGTAPPANYDWKAEPPCGHKYTWMSTADRTGGSGKWPVTATSNWDVTWQSNTGVTGSTTLNATGNDALEIGEYRTVLVQGSGG
jgi:hypothetical protein